MDMQRLLFEQVAFLKEYEELGACEGVQKDYFD